MHAKLEKLTDLVLHRDSPVGEILICIAIEEQHPSFERVCQYVLLDLTTISELELQRQLAWLQLHKLLVQLPRREVILTWLGRMVATALCVDQTVSVGDLIAALSRPSVVPMLSVQLGDHSATASILKLIH